jgi:hypothetical protein
LLSPLQLLNLDSRHQNLTFWNGVSNSTLINILLIVLSNVACCHPMLKTETLADRPSYCNPANLDDCNDSTDSSDDVPVVIVAQTLTVTKHTSSAHPTTTTHHTTTTSKKPESTPPPSSSWQTGGFATYFYQNGNAGACGKKNPDSAKIAAIGTSLIPFAQAHRTDV